MIKKPRGRPAKAKKVIDSFVDVKKPLSPLPKVDKAPHMCECGNAAHDGSHQCWGCSHRS